jgi:hypothetical protein
VAGRTKTSGMVQLQWQVINWYAGETKVQNKELGGGAIIYMMVYFIVMLNAMEKWLW